MTRPNVSIGSTVYLYDGNNRVYARDTKGLGMGAPIYREHWVAQKIEGETPRSWVLQYGRKIPKSYIDPPHGVAYDLETVDRHCWINSHKYKILDQLRQCNDADLFRRIGDWIGYAP